MRPMNKLFFLTLFLLNVNTATGSLEMSLNKLHNSLQDLRNRLTTLRDNLNKLKSTLSGKQVDQPEEVKKIVYDKIDYLEIPEDDLDLPFPENIRQNFPNTSVFEKFYQYFKQKYLSTAVLDNKCQAWIKYPEHYKIHISDEEFEESRLHDELNLLGVLESEKKFEELKKTATPEMLKKLNKQLMDTNYFMKIAELKDRATNNVILAQKQRARGINLFNHLPIALDTIGRACFEKYVLDACLAYINQHDPNRMASANDELWVYTNFLKKFITQNLSSSAENLVLNNAAELTIQSLDDMYFHAERDPDSDYPSSSKNFVWCHCLLGRLLECNDIHPDIRKSLQSNSLKYPLCYLIYETMHITLNHNYFLINKLAHLFNWDKNVEIPKKVSFHIGFEQAFGEIINLFVDNEKMVESKLLIQTQKKEFADKGEILLRDGHPRNIIYGKKREIPLASDPVIDANTKNLPYNDNKNEFQWSQITATNDHPSAVTDNDLRYAIKLHLSRHSCYSVGLIPRDLVEVIKLPIEKEIEKAKIIRKYIINPKEQDRLDNEFKKLRRIVAIGTVLSGVGDFTKSNDINTRFKDILNEKTSEIILKNKATQISQLFTEQIKVNSYYIKEDNTKEQDAHITLHSINQEEWLGVFSYLKSILNRSLDGNANLEKQHKNINAFIKALKENSMQERLEKIMTDKKDKDCLEPIYEALYKIFPS